MNLQNSLSQPDPHVSFLDVIFCLVVFLFVLLMISMSAQKSSDQQVKVAKAKAQEESKQKPIQSTRFRGRGGQPIMKITFSYKKDLGLMANIAGHDFTWFEFRQMVCNFDRREGGSQPALIFSALCDKSYSNVSIDDLEKEFSGLLTRNQIEAAKVKNANYYIMNLYKKAHTDFEKECRNFKKKNTTKYLGNWDNKEIGIRKYTSYGVRKSLGSPYLWFTIDRDKEMIVLGSTKNPLLIDPDTFIDVVSSIRGGDGFYIEYRSPETLKYNSNDKIPDWVVNKVIEPLGFSEIVSQGS